MPNRSRKEFKTYVKYLKQLNPQEGCEFCKFTRQTEQVLHEHTYFWVVKNIFPYSLWDELTVLDHLMLVPKRHTDSLDKLPEEAAIEFVKLISSYEAKGYGVFARAPQSRTKSIVHQHTHLIKNDHQQQRLLLYSRRPYLRVSL